MERVEKGMGGAKGGGEGELPWRPNRQNGPSAEKPAQGGIAREGRAKGLRNEEGKEIRDETAGDAVIGRIGERSASLRNGKEHRKRSASRTAEGRAGRTKP